MVYLFNDLGAGAALADVFISYSSAARPLTEELAAWLQAQRLSVWYDRELRSGVRYPTEIRRQLIAAKASVVLWSRPSLGSEWVYAEAVEAARIGTAVFVAADDVTPVQLPLPFNAGFHVVRLEDRERFSLASVIASMAIWNQPGTWRLMQDGPGFGFSILSSGPSTAKMPRPVRHRS